MDLSEEFTVDLNAREAVFLFRGRPRYRVVRIDKMNEVTLEYLTAQVIRALGSMGSPPSVEGLRELVVGLLVGDPVGIGHINQKAKQEGRAPVSFLGWDCDNGNWLRDA